MQKSPKKGVILNAGLALLVSAIWIYFKNLSIADSVICFVVVFFVLFSIDVFANYTSYRNFKKMAKTKEKK